MSVRSPTVSTTVEELQVADTAEVWERAGFAVADGVCRVGRLRIRLLGPEAGRGIVGWTLAGLPSGVQVREVDGIPTTVAARESDPAAKSAHPNGVTHLDHATASPLEMARPLDAYVHAVAAFTRSDTAPNELALGALRTADALLSSCASGRPVQITTSSP